MALWVYPAHASSDSDIAPGMVGRLPYRNVRGCVGAGVCAFGCPSGAKQHTGVTYVPKAWAAAPERMAVPRPAAPVAA